MRFSPKRRLLPLVMLGLAGTVNLRAEEPPGKEILPKDIPAVVLQSAKQLRTLDVWYRYRRSTEPETGLVRYVADFVTGNYIAKSYRIKDEKTQQVSGIYTESFVGGVRTALAETPASDGRIFIAMDGQEKRSGPILSTGRISNDAQGAFLEVVDFGVDPWTGKPIVDSLLNPKESFVWTIAEENGTRLWRAGNQRMQIDFDSLTRGMARAVFFDFSRTTRETWVSKKVVVSGTLQDKSIPIPGKVDVTYFEKDGKVDSHQSIQLLATNLAINSDVTALIVPPNFPLKCFVTDAIQGKTYTVTAFDGIFNSAPQLIQRLDQIIKEAEEQK